MLVRDLLQRKSAAVITIRETDTIATAVRLLLERGVGGLAVVDEDGALTGFISERDIVTALATQSGDVRRLRVSYAMRQPPVCGLEDQITHLMQRMTGERMRHFVAVDQGRPVGVISVGDIVKQRLIDLELEASVLRDYVAGQRVV